MSMRAYLSKYFPATAADLCELMREVMTRLIEADRKLVLSMELYAAANLEVSDRANFLGLVSSLQPLASQQKNADSVVRLVDSFRQQLQSVQFDGVKADELAKIKSSLNGRLKRLESESIRQALPRVIRELSQATRSQLKQSTQLTLVLLESVSH